MSTFFFDSVKKALTEPEDAFQWKVLHHFCRLLAESNTPISLDALAADLHSSRERVKAGLERNPEIEYDQSGNLLGMGLTLSPTIHQFVLDGHPFYAWCAPDTLGLPVVLKRPARVISACPVTGARVSLELTPDHVESLSPETAVVSLDRTGDIFKRSQEAGCVRQEVCNNQYFFASGEVAAPWVSEHPGFIALPVEEAFLGLREIFLQQMALAAQA
jgi:alkylmercury lyase